MFVLYVPIKAAQKYCFFGEYANLYAIFKQFIAFFLFFSLFYNGVAISIAKLLQLLTYAKGKHLIGIGDWLERKRQQAIDADNHAMDILRRRAAVIGFRAGMLCYLLEDHQYTDIVGQFAEWVAEYVFRNQMELWGDQMEQELSGALEAQTERGAAASLLALLPEEFTTSDLIKLRARKGQSVKASAVCMVINRWRNNHRIVKINETTWRKTNY